jgi:hypothetical protein
MRGVINVDVSQALTSIHEMHQDLSPEMFQKCLDITVKDTGKQAGIIIKKEIARTYEVTQKWVAKKILNPKYSGSAGSGVSCVIPIKGERGSIGGIFPAGGGGMETGKWNGKKKKRLKRQRIVRKKGKSNVTGTILRGKVSWLPDELKNQGGNPPFRLPNGVVVTRRTSNRKPVVRVVGRGVPQMVDKQYEGLIEGKINDYMIKRMEQVVVWKMGRSVK